MNLLTRLRCVMGRLFGAAAAPRSPQALLGKRGEDQALRHLKAAGYRILERNFRWTGGEIDLVAFKDGIVAFVEVRARTEPVGLDPLWTVTRAKQRKLIRTAHRFISYHGLDREDVGFRFDVITVRYGRDGAAPEVEHITNAFET